ncbi:ABC transporter ATP-binding protein [Kribbella solani]|uniref:ABC-type glutathione transport system ATPase component n=1 Tax=Kribbella solani TaxID=236067 RepID=A0A841DYS7_9ACTN|nr:ATP-binding cassette domain-containing protein [Kribbella solani]MBB5983723.1 ABC-type glutathione transport system ATPase component [Kribbella solani]
MTEPILEVAELHKQFGAVTAVNHVSFALAPGESLAIVGESGSGKTTVAKLVVGLEAATSGRIVACGSDRSTPARSAKERRRRGRNVQMVFQDPYLSLDPRQTPAAAIDEVLRLHTTYDTSTRGRRTQELAGLVGLDDRQLHALPARLSGGQRQRVAIARALAAEPQVLILDEAVAALDVSIQAQVLGLLADIRAQTGVAYLFISHDLAVVRQVSDRIAVMKGGEIVEAGETLGTLDHPRHPYTRLLRDSVPGPGWKPSRRPVDLPEEAR